MGNPMFDKEWFRLDNAAKIYPAAKSSGWNAVFRMSAVMKEKVDGEKLQLALNDVIERFPSFDVTLRKGVFWYYHEYVTRKPLVKDERNYPCSMFKIDGESHLFRVLYYKNRISLEVFHSITDGTGALLFLKSLIARYLELRGINVEDTEGIMHYKDIPTEGEVEDAFGRNLDPSFGTLPRSEPSAYQIKGPREAKGTLNVIQAEMDSLELRTAAKKYGATVNTYLASVLEYVLVKRQLFEGSQVKRKPIKVQIPINLRKFFPSITVRNFAGYINTCITPDDKSFDEVIKETQKQLGENINEEYCRKFINSNVSVEKNIFVRLAPRALKTLIMRRSYYSFGEKLSSCLLSNVGNVDAPEEFKEHVDRLEFVLGPQKYINNAMTCISFNGRTVVTFSRTLKDATLEREFFRILKSHGVDMTIISNRGE